MRERERPGSLQRTQNGPIKNLAPLSPPATNACPQSHPGRTKLLCWVHVAGGARTHAALILQFREMAEMICNAGKIILPVVSGTCGRFGRKGA